MRNDAVDPRTLGVPGGVATRAGWLACGANHRMFKDGRLVALTPQIFALPHVLDDPQELVHLVGALAPAGAVLTGWAAALLHGVRDAGPKMLRASGTPVQFCLERHDHRSAHGLATLRVVLDADDVDVIDGLPVTSLERTAYDMTRFSRSLLDAVGVMDAFRFELNPRPFDLDLLGRCIERRPRVRGHPRLRQAIALSSTRSRSFPESELRARMVTLFDLDPANVLVNAMLRGVRRERELDLVDLSTGLVIEYDGAHHADVAQRESDAQKDVEVSEVGLEVVRVNSPTLAKSDTYLADYLRRAQRRAREVDAPSRVTRLVAAGRLAEEPLRRYPSAGQ
ncbi:hypothetical protein [Cumulibacter soli]|uniref:hypothetical protein n=1 Tax=Cumulibacter soli TaxID=2546344 RepID=UPI0010677EFA|nr:hypothetical protein [Cumulibacter soli]